MSPLRVSQLNFGSIDAKNEVLGAEQANPEFFLDSFYVPYNVDLSRFAVGQYLYITGLKGTGKTALLRYLEAIERDKGSVTDFILFKSDFSEEERKRFAHSSSVTLVRENQDELENNLDFEDIWLWFFHRVFQRMFSGNKVIVEQSQHLQEYVELVRTMSPLKEHKSFMSLLPKLRNSRLEVEGDAGLIKGKFSTELGINPADKLVPLFAVARLALDHLASMKIKSGRICLFLDELEISYGKKKSYERDCRLIRDLVVVVAKLNRFFKQNSLPIQIYAAIRSEVIRSIHALGKEINKDLEDFGYRLSWHHAAMNHRHPLLQIVEKKIHSSERLLIGDALSANVWKTYMPTSINDMDIRDYILASTWYRPRDIVRLLKLAGLHAGDRRRLNQEDFESASKEYASASWDEQVEELLSGYTHEEILAIKIILIGGKRIFNLAYFTSEARKKSEVYPEVKHLLARRSIPALLNDLFRVGIIGNSYMYQSGSRKEQEHSWAFRGDNDLLLTRNMSVHRALWNVLSLHRV